MTFSQSIAPPDRDALLESEVVSERVSRAISSIDLILGVSLATLPFDAFSPRPRLGSRVAGSSPGNWL